MQNTSSTCLFKNSKYQNTHEVHITLQHFKYAKIVDTGGKRNIFTSPSEPRPWIATLQPIRRRFGFEPTTSWIESTYLWNWLVCHPIPLLSSNSLFAEPYPWINSSCCFSHPKGYPVINIPVHYFSINFYYNATLTFNARSFGCHSHWRCHPVQPAP